MTNPQQDINPQIKYRRHRILQDRWGRKYETIIDTRTNDSVSRVRPMFKAPWHSPYAVLKHDPESGAMTVDLQEDVVIAERKRALAEWRESLYRYGLAMHGEAFNPERPTAALLRVVGPRPEPAEFALAAKAGDPWTLGQTDVMPAWAKKLRAEMGADVDDYAFLRAEQLDAAAKYEDIEDAHDPSAIGGKRVKVGQR